MTTKMSVTRALATLKNLDAKIEKTIPRLVVVGHTEGTGESLNVLGAGNVTKEGLETAIQADFKSMHDMLNQRNALKRAIVLSNAKTSVTIGKVTMTVAEAIEYKRSIGLKTQLLSHLRKQATAFNSQRDRAQAQYNQALEQAEASMSTRDKKATSAEVELATAGIKLRKTPGVIDPLNIAEQVEKLEAEISDFMLNADFALSEVNAKTEIEA